MIYVLTGIIIVLILILLAVFFYYRGNIRDFSEKLSDTLDDMIDGKVVDFRINEESLTGKLHIKLKRLYQILQDKTKQAQDDREQMQSLISDISHQVKTPVANLKMYNQILKERELTEQQKREFIELADSQIDKLDFLMQALVKMSRLENGIISFKMDKILCQQILADSLAQIMPLAERKNIGITVECPSHMHVVCDKKWTEEAVFNILDNAVKYTPLNGHIEISVSEWEFYTVISIKDDGMGITEEEQPLIFGRFYRMERNRQTDGVGIGLYLSREIISGQGGYIKVRSESGNGAEFLINLRKE